MIIAVDFDGVLCQHKFPEIGESNHIIIALLKSIHKDGNKLILWTCRGGKYLKDAVDWCKSYGLEFDAVNEDVDEIKNSEFGKDKSVKVHADIFLDDRCLNVSWLGLLVGQKG